MIENEEGLDEIGDWSVDKLEILKDYSARYAQILQNQRNQWTGKKQFFTGYIDAFAGIGTHFHKTTKTIVKGSPLIALELPHKFDHYEFIDLDEERVARLKRLTEGRADVTVHHGDCNQVLLEKVLPKYKREAYRRALCFLDPYCLQLDWEVLAEAGRMGSVEIFLNFPIHDMNRNAKREKITDADPKSRAKMTKFWGDESWHAAMFAPSSQENFFAMLGDENALEMEKIDQRSFVAAFQKRLQETARFKYVPDPVPMKNSIGAVVYYLFFASNNDTGARIANSVMKRYR